MERSFLKLNLIILALFLVFTITFGIIGAWTLNYGMQNFLTEIPTYVIWGGLLILLILIIITLVSISTHTKWEIIEKESKIWPSFKSAFKKVRQRFFYFILLGILFLAVSIGLAFLSNVIINYIPESGYFMILLAFLLQLFALYVRVCLRNGYYSAILSKDR